MAAPLTKQICDAIRTRLLSMVAPAYNYAPDGVAIAMFVEACLDSTINTAYVIEPDQNDHEEETTGAIVCRQRLSIIGLRNLGARAEPPYNVDASVPDRRTEQDLLEQDVMNRLTGTAADVTLNGLVENVADLPVLVDKGEHTFHEGWAVVFMRFTVRFSYLKGAL